MVTGAGGGTPSLNRRPARKLRAAPAARRREARSAGARRGPPARGAAGPASAAPLPVPLCPRRDPSAPLHEASPRSLARLAGRLDRERR